MQTDLLYQRLAIIDIVEEVEARPLLETEYQNIKFIYKQCSVTEESELRKCMNEIKSELDWVDIIVNSAGIIDESKWKRTIDINFVCVLTIYCYLSSSILYLVCQYVLGWRC